MPNIRRVFLIVLDSLGVGELPDAALYGDVGSNTLRSCFLTGELQIPTLRRLGLFNIDGIDWEEPHPAPLGAFARMSEASQGKDTTVGHWEIGGVISPVPLPTYPNGFPQELIARFEAETGYAALCNAPYSGTEVLKVYGEEHLRRKSVIVYTSADSVFQVAAHSDAVPIEELYRICETARKLLVGEHGVGRVIARPFDGVFPHFKRTAQRKDFSIAPPRPTFLNYLQQNGRDCVAVGKIEDIFSGSGITESYHSKSNADGMAQTKKLMRHDFHGLCFVNLVDFDAVYGHRNDAIGYTKALNEFDAWLAATLPLLREEDVLILTADHGCDPATPSTDHSREYVPLLLYGKSIPSGVNLGTRSTFADVGKTVLDFFQLEGSIQGASLLKELFL